MKTETKWANGRKRSRNSYPGSGRAGLLDNNDKAQICIEARKAWDSVKEQGSHGAGFREWRRREQFKAVGIESLRHCSKRHLLKLIAHFQDLAGEPGRAVNTHMRDEVKDSAIAMRKLEAECAARGIQISYPAKICAKQYKCALEDASPNQLWRLVFTVRNRRVKVASPPRGVPPMEMPF